MGASREASGFGLLAILDLYEARYLIRPDFIDLLGTLHRQLWITVCFTGSIEPKSLFYPSEMSKYWSLACLRLVFCKSRQVRYVQTGRRKVWEFCLFRVSTRPPSKFSWMWNELVHILKNFEFKAWYLHCLSQEKSTGLHWTRWSYWFYPVTFHEK